MLDKKQIFQLGVVMVFSCGIVAIGAQELHRRYQARGPIAPVDANQLIKELKGEPDIERASLNSRVLAEQKEAAAKQKAETVVKEDSKITKTLDKMVP